MNKSKFWIWYIPVLIIICIIICSLLVINKNKTIMESDAYKFKEEYTALNNQVIESNNKEYPYVELGDSNPFVYASDDNLKSLFDGGTGIIYFGFPKCPWCRNLVPVLSDTATSMGIDKIYYYNILAIRSSYSFDENNKVVSTDGTDFYYYLLNKLSSYLTEYKVKDNDGNYYDTLEKRLYAPTLVFITNGEIVGFHEGTIDSQTDPFTPLTDTQTEELSKVLKEYIKKIQGTCTENC